MAISLLIALYVAGVTAWLAFAPVPDPALHAADREPAGTGQIPIRVQADKSFRL